MYCPINDSENDSNMCTTRCCRLYSIALAFLGAVLFFILGIILALVENALLADTLPLLVVSFVIIFIVFIVTMLTRGCCNNSRRG